jgi:hypothetical protein
MTKEKQEELLERAKRDYPVGTKFLPSHVEGGNYSYCIITDDSHFETTKNGIASIIKGKTWDTDNDEKYGNTILCRYVYCGKWAEIVSRPEPEKWEPKTGDWFYVTKTDTSKHLKQGDVRRVIENPLHLKYGTVYFEQGANIELTRIRLALPHEIPQEEEVEYWELLEGFDGHHTGEIFHTKNPLPNYEFWNWKSWSEILSKQPKYFKPSTRQAYEAQQRVEFAIKVTNEVINNVSQINQSKNEKTKCNTKITIQDLISCGEDYSFPTGKRRTGAKIQLEGCVLPSKSRPIRG